MLTRTGREHVLAQALAPVLDDYHVVLIDCPPSLGLLTINALTASDGVIVPWSSCSGVRELVGIGRRLGFSAGDRAPSVFGSRPQRFVVSAGATSWPLTRSGVSVSAAAALSVVNAVRRVTPRVCRLLLAMP